MTDNHASSYEYVCDICLTSVRHGNKRFVHCDSCSYTYCSECVNVDNPCPFCNLTEITDSDMLLFVSKIHGIDLNMQYHILRKRFNAYEDLRNYLNQYDN